MITAIKGTILGVLIGLIVIALRAQTPTVDDPQTTAIAALKRDGFSEIEIVGHSCYIARATDGEGYRTWAWACETGEPAVNGGTERPMGSNDI